jgi:hypothetical protein
MQLKSLVYILINKDLLKLSQKNFLFKLNISKHQKK